MLHLMRGIQAGAPVDSFDAGAVGCAGYADQVVMAAGAFVQGASIELSADRPFEAALYRLFAGRVDV